MKKIFLFTICSLIFATQFGYVVKAKETALQTPCEVKAKDYTCLFGKLEGLSEKQLKQHYVLYTRYVSKLNEINKKLISVDKNSANAAHSDYRALKIDRAFSNNGVLLHELYFENLCPCPTKPSGAFLKAINKDFCSFENYIADLAASMKSIRNGWVITLYNPLTGRIENQVIEFHDLYVAMNTRPLLVADVWEHSYMIDYGIEKNDYINVFLKNVDWKTVSNRYEQACK